MSKEINDHRNPRLKKEFYLHRVALRDFIIRFSRSVPKGSRILDFGCGFKPYLPYFPDTKYFGVDVFHGSAADVLSYGELPFKDNSFDFLFAFQVMEHVDNPRQIVAEMKRVLRPGGTLLISVPFFGEYHACPNDYWRYTHQGIGVLLKDFADIRVTNDTSPGQTIIGVLCHRIRYLTEKHRCRSLGNLAIMLLNLLGRSLPNREFPLETGYLTLNLIATAVKAGK